MTAYIVEGEALHNVFKPVSEPIDKMIYLPTQHTAKWYDIVGGVSASIKNHLMPAVISALKEAGYN